jgi:transaldolase
MYEEVGVGKDRVLLRMPATWAAIQAGKQLEVEGIACHLVLVYRWVVRKLEWVGGWAGRWES